jgi:hypothetical protein
MTALAIELRELVFNALDIRIENGFPIDGESDADVAIDMLDYDVGIYEATRNREAPAVSELEPLIAEYRSAKATK